MAVSNSPVVIQADQRSGPLILSLIEWPRVARTASARGSISAVQSGSDDGERKGESSPVKLRVPARMRTGGGCRHCSRGSWSWWMSVRRSGRQGELGCVNSKDDRVQQRERGEVERLRQR
jgi:hypothetical protein